MHFALCFSFLSLSLSLSSSFYNACKHSHAHTHTEDYLPRGFAWVSRKNDTNNVIRPHPQHKAHTHSLTHPDTPTHTLPHTQPDTHTHSNTCPLFCLKQPVGLLAVVFATAIVFVANASDASSRQETEVSTRNGNYCLALLFRLL